MSGSRVTVLGSLCALNNLVTSGRFRLIFFAASIFGVPGNGYCR